MSEKQAGLRLALRNMGMLDSAYWASWMAFDAVITLLTALLLVLFGAWPAAGPAAAAGALYPAVLQCCCRSCVAVLAEVAARTAACAANLCSTCSKGSCSCNLGVAQRSVQCWPASLLLTSTHVCVP